MNDALKDELMSINSIYGEETLVLLEPDVNVCTLRFPSIIDISLRIEFPADYPASPPVILGTQSVGNEAVKGAGNDLVEKARETLNRVFRPSEACIYDLVEEIGIMTEQEKELENENIPIVQKQTEISANGSAQDTIEFEPSWTIGETFTEKKSSFQGRVASVTSTEQAKAFTNHYLATDKKAAKATHNIVAWRIRGANGTTYQDCDDDGEDAAGGRLLHLMQLIDVWNVMVICSRWYGGIKLGPDRFRMMNMAARDALQIAGLVKKPDRNPKR